MARMSTAHRTQIIIALITVTGGIIVAVLTSWDKFFPPARVATENHQAAQADTAGQPVVEPPTNELKQLRNSQADLINRSAGALDDITRQIDAQSNSLAGR